MKRLLSYISALLIVGCSQDYIISSEEALDDCTDNEVIDLDEALTGLDLLIDRFADVSNTKAGTPKIYSEKDVTAFGADDISICTKGNLRAEIPDTLLYIVNFEGDNGFAVISANRKLGNFVYCITDKGQISSNDFADAYDLISEASLSVKGITYSDEDYEFTSMGESFIPAIILSSAMGCLENGPIIQDNDKGIDTKAIAKYGLLSTRWTQDPPFNGKTPNNAAPGCVVIAVAQIMAYNEFSITMNYDYVDCQWSIMKTVYPYDNINYAGSSEAQKQVAAFVHELGKSYNCNVRYDNGSWAQADGAKRTLENYGYSNVKKYTGFGNTNQKKARASLDNGYPVYLDGCEKGTTSGHAWVIDGYDGNYFHCNFGWHGSGDGFYYKDTFNPEGHNYTWWFRLITYTK